MLDPNELTDELRELLEKREADERREILRRQTEVPIGDRSDRRQEKDRRNVVRRKEDRE